MKLYLLPASLLMIAIIIAGSYFNLDKLIMFYLVSFSALLIIPVPIYLFSRALTERVDCLVKRNAKQERMVSGDLRVLNYQNCRTSAEMMFLKKLSFMSQITARNYKIKISESEESFVSISTGEPGEAVLTLGSVVMAAREQEDLVIDAVISDLLIVEALRHGDDVLGYLGASISCLFLSRKIEAVLALSTSPRSFSLDAVDQLLEFEVES